MVFLKSCLPLLKLRRLLEQQFVVLQGTSPCKLAGQYSSGRKLHGPVLYCLRAHPWGSSSRTTLILVPHRLHPLLPLTCSPSHLNLRILCYVTFNRVIFLYVLNGERGSVYEFSVWFKFNLWNWLYMPRTRYTESCLMNLQC